MKEKGLTSFLLFMTVHQIPVDCWTKNNRPLYCISTHSSNIQGEFLIKYSNILFTIILHLTYYYYFFPWFCFCFETNDLFHLSRYKFYPYAIAVGCN